MFLQIQTDKLDEKLMNRILSVDHTVMVSIFAQSLDQEKAVKLLKETLSELDKNKIDEQKRASQSGYDMDIMPADLKSMSKNVAETLADVQAGEDRYYNVSIVLTCVEENEKALKSAIEQITAIAQQRSCAIKCLDYRQEKGFMATLPLGYLPSDMKVDVELTTRAVAGFVPFTTVELFHQTGRQLYEGINALSNNPIMADMEMLGNQNALIFGQPGYGKSMDSKIKIYNTMIASDDHVIILDPESEYKSIVKDLGGQTIVLSPTSKDHINPLDINAGYGDDKAAAVMKIDFILSLMELIIGGKFGLEPIEMSIIDVAATAMYERYFDSRMRPEDMPTLEDLYNEIKSLGREDADALAVKMDRFVHGSSNFFNHRTNVDLNNRLICFDIRDVGKQLKPFAMMAVQDQVWNKVTQHRDNNEAKYKIKYFMDEFHLQLNNPQTAAYTVEIYKRFRKYGAYPVGMTQNPYDLMISSQAETIFKNTDYVKMFRLKGDDKKLLASVLKISPAQLKYVTNTPPGRGLLYFGGTIIPFYNKIPKNTHIYEMCTSKKEELVEIAQRNKKKEAEGAAS
jgi:type IV secretory pathway VirB4 component